jgi:hypothetical protein
MSWVDLVNLRTPGGRGGTGMHDLFGGKPKLYESRWGAGLV